MAVVKVVHEKVFRVDENLVLYFREVEKLIF